MAVSRRGKKYVIDYYPQGRLGKRARVTLPASVQDEDDAKAIEQLMKKAARNADDPIVPTGSTVEQVFPGSALKRTSACFILRAFSPLPYRAVGQNTGSRTQGTSTARAPIFQPLKDGA